MVDDDPISQVVYTKAAEEQGFHPWKFVVVHHSATDSGSVKTIHAAHRQRLDSKGKPWKGIGYHFVIGNGNGMPDGAIEATFRWNDQIAGAHAGMAKYNQHGIGICLIGNFEEHPPTDAQMKSATELVTLLQSTFKLGDNQILRHGDLKATACPGSKFPFQKLVAADSDGTGPVRQRTAKRFSPVRPGSKEDISDVATTSRRRYTNANATFSGE